MPATSAGTIKKQPHPPKTKKRPKLGLKVPINPKQELFCQFYVKNEALFANGTLSYAEAYGFKLDTLSHEVPKDDEGNATDDSEYTKAYNVCSVEAYRLLRSPKIQDRVTALLNEMLKDTIVDAQLAKLILQDHEPASKIAAIREYNKLRNRITDKVDLTTNLPFNLTIVQKK